MELDWLTDLKRARSRLFWHRLHKGLLPLDTGSHVLLANAMLQSGAAMFGEAWHGDELYRAHLPILMPQLPKWADGADADYALELVTIFRPEALAVEAGAPRDKYSNPLTPDEWKAAEELYEIHEKGRNLLSIKMAHTIRRTMTRALIDGVLVSATRDRGEYREITARHWNDEPATVWRFIESQMYPADPWKENWPTALEELTRRKAPPALVPGNAWLFVTRASLLPFLEERKVANKPPPAATRYYSDKAIDDELKTLYSEYADNLAERPVRDGPGGVLDLMRQRLEGVQIDRVKERYTITKPADWKQGRRSVH
ncbi:MAG: hypothetical protein E5X67_23805 [Mesorhizobium sp.]|uniref:hypothetical protein n=1 Tax=Mesorhizobium sp. TaxID=1871066 RepID=UPI00120868D4|nr:hypothetical protein [Mesorhizobium sp.]TIP25684.1 MAG: hypothetical protein E5X67_23805 [Mesorhizobium sp.]